MLKLRTDNLTELEKKIHSTLSEAVAENSKLKIIEAADLCDVSPSKVSKLVRKLGFENFKQYKLYFSGQQASVEVRQKSTEIERLIQFLEDYDPEIVDHFISVFKNFNKVILFGLGPSFISAEYFAYKLATITDKNVFVTHHEDYAERLADEDTLLIVFSVTGKFASFENLFSAAKSKGAQAMLILEEQINTRDSQADYIFYLSKYNQSDDLLAFEKTRTIFFIFIEEIITKLNRKSDEMEN
ncbi:MurR/RpiR family transcriptional regulator [Bacillaceae bacterium SIJ1]|uniref:MurR/RpiR family transcriptional regulator n=1 Tax=Litoribacterium kuwaitense TaxID=1398745 RepID=UPI0013EB9481|nr:SIS domain-containing protein [Litoribacterium kuwaitense]NGP45650.1 MurR/RpiR family transcriptional regulator [Litoribacterium kuwaitense]